MTASAVAVGHRKKHHDEEHEEHENHERWLVSYADMMTLLMVLFVVLFAMGTTDTRKFNSFKDSFRTTQIGPAPILKGGIGVLAADNAVQLVPTINHSDQAAPTQAMSAQSLQKAAEDATLKAAQAKMQAALDKAGLSSDVHFHLDANGLLVTIATDKVLFASGSADLLGSGTAIIDALGPSLDSLPNQIAVNGHTDGTPLSPGAQYASNWELSTARAVAVVHHLIDVNRLPGNRLAASGFADTKPIAPNDTPTHQAENRRVEVLVEPMTIPAS